MIESKYLLQNSLDTPFSKLQLITRSRFWTLLGLDKIDNLIYRDTDRDYKRAYVNISANRRRQLNIKDRGDAWDNAWKIADEDIAELDAVTFDTPENTPQPAAEDTTLPSYLDENPEAFLTAYRRKRSIATKLAFYRDSMTFSEEERTIFFSKLSKVEQTVLYQQLNQQEKNAVYQLYTTQ